MTGMYDGRRTAAARGEAFQKESTALVGRIILADLLNMPLEKYRRFAENAENLARFWEKQGRRVKTRGLALTGARGSTRVKRAGKAVARIIKTVRSLSIEYTSGEFNKVHDIGGLLFETNAGLWHRLRRVNTRNSLTHGILNGVIGLQRLYFTTGDPVDLVPLSQVRLTEWLNKSLSGSPRCVRRRVCEKV